MLSENIRNRKFYCKENEVGEPLHILESNKRL